MCRCTYRTLHSFEWYFIKPISCGRISIPIDGALIRYKAGRQCTDAGAANEPCCTTSDKDVFGNVWSLRSSDHTAAMLTRNQTEAREMVHGEGWLERCNPINGPTVFCVDTVRDGTLAVSNRGALITMVKCVACRRCSMHEMGHSCFTLYLLRYVHGVRVPRATFVPPE